MAGGSPGGITPRGNLLRWLRGLVEGDDLRVSRDCDAPGTGLGKELVLLPSKRQLLAEVAHLLERTDDAGVLALNAILPDHQVVEDRLGPLDLAFQVLVGLDLGDALPELLLGEGSVAVVIGNRHLLQ